MVGFWSTKSIATLVIPGSARRTTLQFYSINYNCKFYSTVIVGKFSHVNLHWKFLTVTNTLQDSTVVKLQLSKSLILHASMVYLTF